MTGEASAATRAKPLITRAADVSGDAQAHVDAGMAATDATRDAVVTVVGDELDQAERAVLVALAGGQSPAEIAAALRVSEEMLGIVMANVLAKLHRQHAALHRQHAPGTAHGRARASGPGPTANR